MSQQSEMADSVYTRLNQSPVATAHLVRELRQRRGFEHSISSVHGFVREVATCLLWNGDVDIGDFREARFVSWSLEPEDANERINKELMSMDTFLEDENRQVFQQKNAIQSDRDITDISSNVPPNDEATFL